MSQLKLEFVRKACASGANLSALCREYEITRKTGRQWRDRAEAGGLDALIERSRRPLHSPQALSEDDVCLLVSLKMAWPHWGPKKLSELFREQRQQRISLSSCHRIFKACGLVQTRPWRVRRPVRQSVAAKVARGPNQVWTVDFKGWWRTRDRQRCEPLIVRDAFSRYVLTAFVPKSSRVSDLMPEFERLFTTYGLPAVIKSDNGAPFASATTPLGLSQLSAWWVALGIELERSRPAHPQDNGAHERLHRDIAVEVAACAAPDPVTQQAALDVWRTDHNEVRPHEHLRQKRPAQLYQPSARKYTPGPVELDYGCGFVPRLISSIGKISYQGRMIFITTALAGWHVGLKLIAPELLEVWFNYLRLGSINLKTNRFDSAPSRSVKPVGLAA